MGKLLVSLTALREFYDFRLLNACKFGVLYKSFVILSCHPPTFYCPFFVAKSICTSPAL